MAAKNMMGKSRKPGNAYLDIVISNGWRYEILKLYKSVESSMKDPYARAFCYVHGIENEYGDVYLSDIASGMVGGGVALFAALKRKEEYLAAPMVSA